MVKKKVNKSEEIRKYVKGHPGASAKGVVEALKKKGITVTAAMVATVKSKSGLSKKRIPTTTRKRTLVASAQPLSADLLCAAKILSLKAGSTDKAIEALRTIQKIESISV